MKFHTIVVTKGRQLAARFTYSRGSGQKENRRVCISAGKRAGYVCVSHEGSRQRLASGNKLRVVLFTSSRKLDTKAGKKERRQLRMPSWKAVRAEKKRFHAPSKTRTDTFTYFSAPLPLSFFSFPFFIHRPAFIFCACFIRTTTRETSCAIYVFRYRRGQMVPRHAAPSTVFTTLCLLTSFNRFACPRQFPFSFGGMKNNVGSYVVS